MADKSKIEWTDTTWNPITGCTKISPGCDNCYAERIAERFRGQPGYPQGFDLTYHPNRYEAPLKWASPRLVFVNSMSDLFHKDIPDSVRDTLFDVMEHPKAAKHTFQILTKRSSIMRDYINARYPATPPANIWLGVSVEDGQRVGRIDHLRSTNCALRFISFEPLLGAIGQANLAGIGWVIVGGESGPGHRPIEPGWVRDIRDQCAAVDVPYFFKQWGGYTAKAGGAELDGILHQAMPHGAMTKILTKTSL